MMFALRGPFRIFKIGFLDPALWTETEQFAPDRVVSAAVEEFLGDALGAFFGGVWLATFGAVPGLGPGQFARFEKLGIEHESGLGCEGIFRADSRAEAAVEAIQGCVEQDVLVCRDAQCLHFALVGTGATKRAAGLVADDRCEGWVRDDGGRWRAGRRRVQPSGEDVAQRHSLPGFAG